MAGLRLLLDTNVLVSWLVYPGSIQGRIVSRWRGGGVDVVLSRYILDETARVLPRLSRIQLNSAEIRDLADSLIFLADMVESDAETEVSLRVAADQQLLGTLPSSRANYFITGDKDLLAVAEKYPIVTPALFWSQHG